jgi:hypothetical protein
VYRICPSNIPRRGEFISYSFSLVCRLLRNLPSAADRSRFCAALFGRNISVSGAFNNP